MTNNRDSAGQWPDASNGAQRGPSFEDPMQTPNPYAAPIQDQNPYAAPVQDQNPYAIQPSPYQQPYGSHGGYGVYSYPTPTRSKATAALLAFFLGGLGAHSFYLGNRTLGLTHVILGIVGFLTMVISGSALDTASSSEELVPAIMVLLGLMMWMGNGLWAFVEFLIILITPENELGR